MIPLVICLTIILILGGLCIWGIWIPNAPSQVAFPVRGIDVSHHQSTIDWEAVSHSGISFAYIKATEGAGFSDPKFSENWTNSKSAGLHRGAYHFFALDMSGKSQADNFIRAVPLEADSLPPAIDLEFSGYNHYRRPSPVDFARELAIFWDAVLRQYGKTPVIYTDGEFEKRYLAQMPIERLWICEALTKPRRPWLFWQFSSRGRVAGVQTFVDLDVFQGSTEDFERLSR